MDHCPKRSLLMVGFLPALDSLCDILATAFDVHRVVAFENAPEAMRFLSFNGVLLSPSLTRFEQINLCRQAHEEFKIPVIAFYTFAVDTDVKADLTLSAFNGPEATVRAIQTFLRRGQSVAA